MYASHVEVEAGDTRRGNPHLNPPSGGTGLGLSGLASGAFGGLASNPASTPGTSSRAVDRGTCAGSSPSSPSPAEAELEPEAEAEAAPQRAFNFKVNFKHSLRALRRPLDGQRAGPPSIGLRGKAKVEWRRRHFQLLAEQKRMLMLPLAQPQTALRAAALPIPIHIGIPVPFNLRRLLESACCEEDDGRATGWLERMKAAIDVAQAWRDMDGLFRCDANMNRAEPWNSRRLQLQLARASGKALEMAAGSATKVSVRASASASASASAAAPASAATATVTATATGAGFEETVAASLREDPELQGCGVSTPRLLLGPSSSPGPDLAQRLRSHMKSKRRQLFATQLYELRLDVARVTLFPRRAASALSSPSPSSSSPSPSSSRASRHGPLAALATAEACVVAELLELFHEYERHREAALAQQLDGRLRALLANTQHLRQAWSEEERNAGACSATGQVTAAPAREAYRQHLLERRRLRARREEGGRHLELVCKRLYTTWRELRRLRQEQGFTSTPWRLRALPESQAQTGLDPQTQRAQDLSAEAEEAVGLDGTSPEEVASWQATRASASTALAYRFELSACEEITPDEELRARGLHAEIRQRQLLSRTHVRLVCRIGERIIGSSPSFPVRWETWSTTPLSAFTSRGKSEPEHTTVANRASVVLHSFDLAVHVMPRNLSLSVEVSTPSAWQPLRRWHSALEVEVEVPGLDGRRVTHSAASHQVLPFGTPLRGLGTCTGITDEGAVENGNESSISGELLVSVWWPGAARTQEFVVPPSRMSGEHGGGRGLDLHASTSTSTSGCLWPRLVRAVDECLRCRSAVTSPQVHARARRSTQGAAGGPDERLGKPGRGGLRYDPQDPENARVLLESPAPKALPGYDVARLRLECCRALCRGAGQEADLRSCKRVRQLLLRAETEGVELGSSLVAAFELEVPGSLGRSTQHGQIAALSSEGEAIGEQLGDLQLRQQRLSEEQQAFLSRVRERVERATRVRTHRPYRSVVREHGDEVVEASSTLPELIQRILRGLQPKRPLFPRRGTAHSRGTPGAAETLQVHVSFARLHNAPERTQVTESVEHTPAESIVKQPPVFGLASTAVEGGHLAEVVVELSLLGAGGAARRRTVRAAPSRNPDVNQLLELQVPLDASSARGASGGSVGPEQPGPGPGPSPGPGKGPEQVGPRPSPGPGLGPGPGLWLGIFDEVALPEPERGGELRSRVQRRQLGVLRLPWGVLRAGAAAGPGRGCRLLRVRQPPVLLGYRFSPPQLRAPTAGGPGHTHGHGPGHGTGHAAPTLAPAAENTPHPMCLGLSITLDPGSDVLCKASLPQPVRGKEPGVLLKHAQRWLDSLFPGHRARAFGTDMDGRSRLLCRFLQPRPPPPHIDPAAPFAIEAAARYVSLIPYLSDAEISPLLEDLWCTDEEFLKMRCGDSEEHAVLLCNYFNFVDRFRQERVSGYGDAEIQSYCMLCDSWEGEVWMVLRRDSASHHCEIWQPVTGESYFLPDKNKETGSWRRSCCPRRASTPAGGLGDTAEAGLTAETGADPEGEAARARVVEAGAHLKATPLIPVRQVHVIFNSENIWAARMRQQPGWQSHGLGVSFELGNARQWSPLFARGHQDLLRLSAGNLQASSSSELASDVAGFRSVPGPGLAAGSNAGSGNPLGWPAWASALLYKPADSKLASYLESKVENELEEMVRRHRSLGRHHGVQQTTRFNRVIALRLGEVLEELELLRGCQRQGGEEAPAPLQSQKPRPVSLAALELRLTEVQRDFQAVGRPGRGVFGIPFNVPFADFNLKALWEEVCESRVLELGDESSEYALRVRVFPYASGILSLWLFLACSLAG